MPPLSAGSTGVQSELVVRNGHGGRASVLTSLSVNKTIEHKALLSVPAASPSPRGFGVRALCAAFLLAPTTPDYTDQRLQFDFNCRSSSLAAVGTARSSAPPKRTRTSRRKKKTDALCPHAAQKIRPSRTPGRR